MNRRVAILLLLCVAIVSPLRAPAAATGDAVPEEISAAAGRGLQQFLAAIPPGELANFGFSDPAELPKAQLGLPFQVHTMDAAEILAVADGRAQSAPIRPTSLWQFPVICEGTLRTLLTVDQVDGIWQAVDLGGRSPAGDLEILRERWPASAGYRLQYVRVFQSGAQLIAVRHDDVTQLVPIESTARSHGLLPGTASFEYRPMDLAEAIAVLAPYVRANIESFER